MASPDSAEIASLAASVASENVQEETQFLLTALFKENNELRSCNHALHRELLSKCMLIDELQDVKTEKCIVQDTTVNADLEEALLELDKKCAEIDALNSEVHAQNAQIESLKSEKQCLRTIIDNTRRESVVDAPVISRSGSKLANFPSRDSRLGSIGLPAVVVEDAGHEKTHKLIVSLKNEVIELQSVIDRQNAQISNFSTDACKRHGAIQSELQSMESLVDKMRIQYEEFVLITRKEHGALRDRLEHENAELRESFIQHKRDQLEEHRAMINDDQCILHTMQALFDEFRKASSFMVNMETSKLEDELMNQSLRYEHEIRYVIHSKDKFYADMMVNKDAKIMSLIEGSDLSALLEKHEAELEAMRRECTLELQRFKNQLENEQTQIIAMLQRQNGVLESKTDKLQLHVKSLEQKTKELTNSLEHKNKLLLQREEERIVADALFNKQLANERERYLNVFNEKENLRHRIIRMKMEQKGSGSYSIAQMVARLSKESTDLNHQFHHLHVAHEDASLELNTKRIILREKNKTIEQMSKEIKKRTEEFNAMVNVFETFISLSFKKAKKKAKKMEHNSNIIHFTNLSALMPIKVSIPERKRVGLTASDQEEFARANAFLNRFKALSKAFGATNKSDLEHQGTEQIVTKKQEIFNPSIFGDLPENEDMQTYTESLPEVRAQEYFPPKANAKPVLYGIPGLSKPMFEAFCSKNKKQ